MSTKNLLEFGQKAASDPALLARIEAIEAQSPREYAEKVSALSSETDTPFTADEFLAQAQGTASELTDEQLEGVAGGNARLGLSWGLGILSPMGKIIDEVASLASTGKMYSPERPS